MCGDLSHTNATLINEAIQIYMRKAKGVIVYGGYREMSDKIQCAIYDLVRYINILNLCYYLLEAGEGPPTLYARRLLD